MQIAEFQLTFTLRFLKNARQLTCSIEVGTFGMSFNSAETAFIWNFSVIVLLCMAVPHRLILQRREPFGKV